MTIILIIIKIKDKVNQKSNVDNNKNDNINNNVTTERKRSSQAQPQTQPQKRSSQTKIPEQQPQQEQQQQEQQQLDDNDNTFQFVNYNDTILRYTMQQTNENIQNQLYDLYCNPTTHILLIDAFNEIKNISDYLKQKILWNALFKRWQKYIQ